MCSRKNQWYRKQIRMEEMQQWRKVGQRYGQQESIASSGLEVQVVVRQHQEEIGLHNFVISLSHPHALHHLQAWCEIGRPHPQAHINGPQYSLIPSSPPQATIRLCESSGASQKGPSVVLVPMLSELGVQASSAEVRMLWLVGWLVGQEVNWLVG